MSKKKLVSGFSLRHFMIVSSKIKKRFYPEQEKAVDGKSDISGKRTIPGSAQTLAGQCA